MKKKYFMALLIVVFSTIFVGSVLAQSGHGSAAVDESIKTVMHGSASAGHSIAASGQATSVASAVPLSIMGAAGAASSEIAKDLMDAATKPIGEPLEISDETVTSISPDQALKKSE